MFLNSVTSVASCSTNFFAMEWPRENKINEAIADFTEAYAERNEADHAALLKDVCSGRLQVITESNR